MNMEFVFKLIELATTIGRNHASGKTAEVLTGIAEMERLLQAGTQAVRDQAGKPIDPSLVAP